MTIFSIIDDVKKVVIEIQSRPWRERATIYVKLDQARRNHQWLELIGSYRKIASMGLSEENEPAFRAALLTGLDNQKKQTEVRIEEAERERAAAEKRLKLAYKDERPIQDMAHERCEGQVRPAIGGYRSADHPPDDHHGCPGASAIPARLHAMSKEQNEAIKDYMKSGRPVLACMGPISGASGPERAAVDDFERLISERGIELGKETILYNSEGKTFAGGRAESTTWFQPSRTSPLGYQRAARRSGQPY